MHPRGASWRRLLPPRPLRPFPARPPGEGRLGQWAPGAAICPNLPLGHVAVLPAAPSLMIVAQFQGQEQAHGGGGKSETLRKGVRVVWNCGGRRSASPHHADRSQRGAGRVPRGAFCLSPSRAVPHPISLLWGQ